MTWHTMLLLLLLLFVIPHADSVIFVNENENDEKRENNEFINENYN